MCGFSQWGQRGHTGSGSKGLEKSCNPKKGGGGSRNRKEDKLQQEKIATRSKTELNRSNTWVEQAIWRELSPLRHRGGSEVFDFKGKSVKNATADQRHWEYSTSPETLVHTHSHTHTFAKGETNYNCCFLKGKL